MQGHSNSAEASIGGMCGEAENLMDNAVFQITFDLCEKWVMGPMVK